MINMSHYCHNRSTRLQIFFVIFLFCNSLCYLSTYIFCLVSEFFRYQVDCLGIQTLVDRNHYTDTHTSSDNLSNRNIHHTCQFVRSNELGQFQYFAIFLFHLLLFHQAVLNIFTFLLTILGSLVLSLVSQTCQCFLNLLCHIFITNFRFYNRFLETVFIKFASTLIVIAIRFGVIVPIRSVSVIVTLVIIRCSSSICCTGSIYIHTFLIYSIAFFLLCSIIVNRVFRNLIVSLTDFFDNSILHQFTLFLTLLIFLFSLFPFFFLRFLFRTGRLIQCSQINLTYYINFRFKFSRTNFKYIVFFFFLNGCCFGCFFFHLFHLGCLFFRLFNFRLFLLFQNWSRSRLRSRFRFLFLYHHRLRRFLLGLGSFLPLNHLFHHGFCFRSLFNNFRNWFYNLWRSFLVQIVQIYFTHLLQFGACLFRNNSFHHLFFLFLRFKTFDRDRSFVAVLVLSFLTKFFRLYF